MARFCIRQRLLLIAGNARITASTKHFRRPACVAKNVAGFWLF